MCSNKPVIVNLFGGPGTGKSTGAAYIFSKLKMLGVNAELVTEFAKDKVWEDTHAPFENQLYMLAKQYFRITRCENKVDIIVTDSPLILSLIYNCDHNRFDESFEKLTWHLFNYYNNFNVMLRRVKPYSSVGRFQTEDEAKGLDNDIQTLLDTNHVQYEEYDATEEGYDCIVKDIVKMLEE